MKVPMMAMFLLLCAVDLQAAETAQHREELEAQGRELFEIRCGICHQLPEPDMLTPSKWKRLLDLMQKRMQQAGMPPLDDDEYVAIHTYLTAQSK